MLYEVITALDRPYAEISKLLRKMRKSESDARAVAEELDRPMDTLLVVEKRLKGTDRKFAKVKDGTLRRSSDYGKERVL